MPKNVDFGDRVKHLRRRSGLTLEKLARYSGIQLFRLASIERGRSDDSDLSKAELAALARTLRASSKWLVYGDLNAGLNSLVAQRLSSGPRQGSLYDAAEPCPTCGNAIYGARCDGCGRSPE